MELIIKETLEKLLEILQVSFSDIKVKKENNEAYYTEIMTDNAPLLIGWHGETIAALQHVLKCLLWQKGVDSKTQVIVDVDGYKKRQEESVLRLAERKIQMAIANQKETLLPPMNAYFRRKVHLFIAENEKYKKLVLTESVGVGLERQIKVIPL